MGTRAIPERGPGPGHGVTTRLLRWYSSAGRRLPWRSTRDPYRILVSEVMLQQTQVSRVLQLYPRFLRRFPDVRSLASARRRDVITAWRGMGYNNRAVRLHELARIVVREYREKIPADTGPLVALPGVGPYTVSAVQAFAFGQKIAAVDVNVRRVLSRSMFRMSSFGAVRPEAEIRVLAARLLPDRRAYEWNQALMDLGATTCTARRPACNRCPLARSCASRTTMRPEGPRRRRSEPSMAGIPNRIHRGRIIEMLRGSGTIRAATIGRSLLPRFGPAHHRWLAGVLNGLEKDGLLRQRGTGRFTHRRVSLA